MLLRVSHRRIMMTIRRYARISAAMTALRSRSRKMRSFLDQ
jgi:hypothetical protein